MMKTTLMKSAQLAPLVALFSCGAPKAIVVELPAKPKKEVAAVEPELSAPVVPPVANDGIRLPDMMTLPSDDEFRKAGAGQSAQTSDSGAVIARPPMEPPARPDAPGVE